MRARTNRPERGFTLVEVLVALFAMALLASLAWQGLDSVLRSRDAGRLAVERTVRLSTVMVQWEQDLAALFDTGVVPALGFDGRTLRLTRRVDGGVVLLAWALHDGRWQRWVGPVVTRAGDLQDLWLRSQQMLGNEPGTLTLAEGVTDWQIYFHRGSQWSNAQSSGDIADAPDTPASAAPVAREALPNAVRLVITLDDGKLMRDIALGPQGQ